MADHPEARKAQRLDVGDGHVLAIWEYGNPDGLPVVVLHGGPGGGCSPAQAATFDPDLCRIVLFDQRGAGQSTPHAGTEANTTEALVGDIERIRIHLGIERWLVAGGSWGSCLALAYAEAHPASCLALRLHGIFLGRPEDIAWWFEGSRAIWPDEWERFAGFIPEAERDDLLGAYHRRLIGPDERQALAAALSLRLFSARTQTFMPDPDHVARCLAPEAALPLSRLFAHYCANGCFLPDGGLLDGIDRIRHLPCEIVQGRYDTVTPMSTAWDLHRAWPEAGFTVVDASNHASTGGDMAAALAAASRRLHPRARLVQAGG